MKTLKKILIILIISIGIFMVMPRNISMAAPYATVSADTGGKGGAGTSVSSKVGDIGNQVENYQNIDFGGLSTTVAKLLGFLRVASGLIAVVVIAFTGFNYITAETPDMKKQIKEKMLPIIIGLIVVFSAIAITQFILGVVDG